MTNDKVGLIVFAGDAYTIQRPITSDYISAKMFLNGITTDMVPYFREQLSEPRLRWQ